MACWSGEDRRSDRNGVSGGAIGPALTVLSDDTRGGYMPTELLRTAPAPGMVWIPGGSFTMARRITIRKKHLSARLR